MSEQNENEGGVDPTPKTEGAFSANGSGSVSQSVNFSGGTPEGPGFSWSGTLTVPAGNIYTISVSADDSVTVSGGGISASSHWDAGAKTIVPGSATSDWAEFDENAGDVTFTVEYSNAGGPYTLSASVTSTRCPPKEEQPEVTDGDEKCECPNQCSGNCDMASKTAVKSVRFEQPFGSTPYAAGVPAGTLVLKEETAEGELFSPLGLKYDHLLARRVTAKDAGTQSATVSADGLWENVYAGGVPSEENAWKNSQVRVNADGSVVELLRDRTEIRYGADGNFSSVKTRAGVELTAAQLGVEVIRDAETGAIRQIWSLADGLLDIVSTGTRRYEIRWHKTGDFSGKNSDGLYEPTGDPIKVFECGAPTGTANAFSITEKRGSQFSFESRWTFNAGNSEWVFERGNDVRISRAWTKNEAGNFVVTETKTVPAEAGTRAVVAFVSEEEISPANGNRIVGKTVGGVAEYSATRVSSGNGLGKIASETDRAGTTRSCAYDAAGRVSSETLSRGFADFSETTEYAYAETAEGEFADFRPRSAVHKIAGTVFRTETFSYDDDFENGREETRAVTANGETLTSRTLYYPANTGTVGAGRVKLEIRADGTATLHEYSAVSIPAAVGMASNLGYAETVTEGVFEDGGFSPVPGKSTRRIRTFDTRGNETRTEEHVHTGTAFELVSWENKTYSPAHKVIATTRSDGKTTSADWICTGAVWTIDAEGVRTDNAFDSAKRLASSTRRGARGDVTTTYGYDEDSRVISETETSGELTRTRSRAYNALGELVSETDALGNTTLHSVSEDGLTETTTFPDGGTRIVVRNADGSLASETGTAVVPKYYSYAFDAANKLKITTVFTGSADSARREKTYVDGHGRTVKTERPGFGENAVLTTENAYAGTRLTGVSETGRPTISYAHDALGNVISRYAYENDALGRRVSMTKSGTMMSAVETIAYGYNSRSELVSAVSDADAANAYGYAFDAIGNRETSSESGSALSYTTNSLNQYSSIGRSGVSPLSPDAETQSDVPSPQAGRSDTLVASAVQPESQNDFSMGEAASSPLSPDAGTRNSSASQSDAPSGEATFQSLQNLNTENTENTEEESSFTPTYDADGNMMTVQTSTGTWTVEYNGENRPVTWTKSSGEKIHMMYDSQGRRVEKRVLNAAGVRTLRERYIYVGYTCVQVLNGDAGNAVVKEFAWDPTEPVATRPLMFKYAPNGVTLFYAFDGNKNVSDVFSWAVRNGVPAHYDYAPFGAITRTAKNTPFTLDLISLNPWRFSSEFYDSELDLVYYNYRHYSPLLGRFLSRDPIEEQGGTNLYAISKNRTSFDILGLCNSFEVINRSVYGATSQHPVPPSCEKIDECRWRITAGSVISTPVIVADSANYTLRGADGYLYRAICKRLPAGMDATRKHEEAHIRYAEQGVERINSELGLPKEFETDTACQGELRNVLSAWNKKYSILAHENFYHLGGAPKPTPSTFEQEYAAGLCKIEKL